MKTNNTQKLGAFDTKSLASLKQEESAYIPGIIKDKNNYKIPATDFMDRVYHDDTLAGDGTPELPLKVVGGNSGSCSVNSLMNTIIVTESPAKHYHIEGTNWGYRYNITWDDSAPVETLYSVNGNIETEIIHELGDPALKFVMQDNPDVVTKFYLMTSKTDYFGVELAQFTGDFVYQFNPDSVGNYYSLNIETTNLPPNPNEAVTYNDNVLMFNNNIVEYTTETTPTTTTTNNSVNTSTLRIDVYSGTAVIGSQPEELMIANDLERVELDDFVGAYTVN